MRVVAVRDAARCARGPAFGHDRGNRVMDTAADATALVFRDARVADVAAIVALVESAYRGDSSRAGWTTEADLLDGQRIDVVGVAEIVVRRGSRVLLAEANGELLACCHLEKQGGSCYFGMFSV